MGLFSSKPSNPTPPETAPAPAASGPRPKGAPTPSRREAEAARMARLHPELDPKKARELNREARAEQRRTQMAAVDNLPQRALMRDVVDSRFNIGEIALPLMMLILVVMFIPAVRAMADVTLYALWAVIVMIAVDLYLMWARYKKLAAQRLPGASLRGMMFYGWNRQMSIRRWRLPAPRVKRGDQI